MNPNQRILTIEEEIEIARLRQEEKITWRKLAKQFRCSTNTIYRVFLKHGILSLFLMTYFGLIHYGFTLLILLLSGTIFAISSKFSGSE